MSGSSESFNLGIHSTLSDFANQDCINQTCRSRDVTSVFDTASWTGLKEYDDLLNRIFRFIEEQGFFEIEEIHGACGGRNVVLDSRQTVNAPLKLVRGQGFIRAPTKHVFEMILNVEHRPRWDDLCDHGSVVKRLGPSSDIIYLSYQGKLGVCARDLCLLRAWKQFADGSVLLISHSVDCDEVPKVAGKVRAELRECGYHVKPEGEGCILSYVIQLDMKGYVPLFFSNLIQTQHPLIITTMRELLELPQSAVSAGGGAGAAAAAVATGFVPEPP